MTAGSDVHVGDAARLVIDQANRDHGRLTPSSILMLATIAKEGDRLAAVRALHQPSEPGTGGEAGPFCLHDGFSWPCGTARALGVKS